MRSPTRASRPARSIDGAFAGCAPSEATHAIARVAAINVRTRLPPTRKEYPTAQASEWEKFGRLTVCWCCQPTVRSVTTDRLTLPVGWRLATAVQLYGGCSSGVERLTVAQEVAGSKPVTHPNLRLLLLIYYDGIQTATRARVGKP